MGNAIGKIMQINARTAGWILWVMLDGKSAKNNNLVPRELWIMFHSCWFHKSVAAIVAKISYKILTCRWIIHSCLSEFSQSLKQQFQQTKFHSHYNVKKYWDVQNNPLDVSNLQWFIIPVWGKQHNMKERNYCIMNIFITYKSQKI